MQKICPHIQTASWLFVFCGPLGQGDVGKATYLAVCLDCTKSMHTNWNIDVAVGIHVNLDLAWAEHYPITLSVDLVNRGS